MYIKKEHDILPDELLNAISEECSNGMLLNPQAKKEDRKYFFYWNQDHFQGPCYTASYIIGAQRIGNEELVIEPKFDNVDFMKMFSVCLSSNLNPDYFSKIYDVDLDAEPIKTDSYISAALTPLLIVHFIMLINRIVSKGLRSDYIEKNENLKKVKGRIDISNNERRNVIYKRYDRVFCKYSERSVDIPENRLFKKALSYCKQYIIQMKNHDNYQTLVSRINNCLSAFCNVSDEFELQEITNSKRNKIYKDYDSSINVAKMILKRFDYSISHIGLCEQKTPVFWIDMALLYEYYVYGLLYNAYESEILYQKSGDEGWKPDFLNKKDKIIMDAKYIDYDSKKMKGDIIRQLSGYARAKCFADILDVDINTIIPCLILYPTEHKNAESFRFDTDKNLIKQSDLIPDFIDFYKLGIPLPRRIG